MTDDVNVKFGADTASASAAIKQLQGSLEQISAPISELMSAFNEFKEAFVAAFAVEKISEFVEKMAELGTATERTMAVLGVSSKEVGELSLMAAMTGTSMQGMTMSLQRLQTNLQTASDPASKVGKALAAIGLSAKDLIGIPIPEQMNKIADGLSKFADGGNKTAIAMALLGRGAAGMLPAMENGRVGLDAMRQAGDDAAVSLTDKTVKALEDVHQKSVTLGAALTSLGAAIVGSFQPSLVTGIQALTDVVSAFNAVIQAGTLWQTVLKEIQFTWDFFIAGMKQNAVFLANVFTLNWGSIKSDWQKGTAELQAVSTDHWNEMLRQAGIAKLKLAAILAAKPEGDKPQAKAIDMGSGADTAAASAAKDLEAQIKVMETSLQTQKSFLDQELAQHKITQAQKFQSLQDYTDDAYGTEKQLLEKELSLYASGTTQYAAVKAKLLELDAKYALDSQKITTEAVKAQQKSYMDMFNAVQSAFNSQLKGLLAGTTSWSQAFKSILGDLIIKFIEGIEKMGFEWLAGQLAQTAATTAGVTARTTAEVAGSTVSSAANFASIFKSIMASASQTFAGIFGFLSPVMGPAAAAPAAVGEATVAASAAAIYEQGTPWVPSDGMAMLHRGEAVIPAGANAAGLDGGSSGGDTHVHLHLNGGVNDAAGLARFWKDNARNIASAVKKHATLSPGMA